MIQKQIGFGGRMRINSFLDKIGDGEIGLNFRKDGRVVSFNEEEPIFIQPQEGYEFSLSGEIDGKETQTRAYPVVHRKNSAWCKVEGIGLIEQINSTTDGVPVDIEDPICKRFGSRTEVYRGLARKTTGRLQKNDLIKIEGGKIVSKKEKKHLDNRRMRLDIPTSIRAPEQEGFTFQDVAEGLSLDDLYSLAQDDLDVEQRGMVRRFIEYRITSLISDCLNFKILTENGRPLKATDREIREFDSILSAVLNEIPQLVYKGMNPVDATEEAIEKFCLI